MGERLEDEADAFLGNQVDEQPPDEGDGDLNLLSLDLELVEQSNSLPLAEFVGLD